MARGVARAGTGQLTATTPSEATPAEQPWTRLGSAPAALALQERVHEALAGARAMLGGAVAAVPDAADAGPVLDQAAALLTARLDEPGAEVAAAARLLVAVVEARRLLREHVLGERVAAMAGVQAGLARLRGIGSVAAMIERAPMEVCRACGFDRAVLMRVRDGMMAAESTYDARDPERASLVLEVSRAAPAVLDHLVIEAEMVRRRMPVLVADVEQDPRVYRAIVDASGVRSYVGAPLMPEGRVIGFLHADRFHSRRICDEFDRDLLWTFAEGFGYAFERTVLLERMRAQREQVRTMIASTDHLVQELCDTELSVARIEPPDLATEGPAAAVLASPPSPFEGVLTPREIEVIRLMAAGETNAGIAAKLVISEGTVKSHVKHILRKLRAANRAEAVSRWLRIAAVDD